MTIQTTKCPNCHTVFRVGDEQLEKAEGTVRCSQCSEIFNALAFLSAETPSSEPEHSSIATETTEYNFAQTMEDVQDDLQDLTIPDELNEEPQENNTLSEIISALKDEANEGNEFEKTTTEKEPVFRDHLEDEYSDTDIPSVLEEDLITRQTPENKTRPIFLGFCSLILISLLAIQYAYFSREKLAMDPRFRPWLTTMCEYLQCNLSYKKDLSLIHLLSRDVLIAPTNNKDTLIIQLSFVNKAEYIQSFPVLQVYLSDAYGKATAMRRFKPGAYLDPSVDIKQGLEPLAPVSLTLELLKPEKEVSAFQIDFL